MSEMPPAKDSNGTKNVVLAAISGIMLVAAAVLLIGWIRPPSSDAAQPGDDQDIDVVCSICHEKSQMKFKDYRIASEAAARNGAQKVTCPKCGKAGAWKVGGFQLKNPTVPEDMAKQAWSNVDGTAPPKRDYNKEPPVTPKSPTKDGQANGETHEKKPAQEDAGAPKPSENENSDESSDGTP